MRKGKRVKLFIRSFNNPSGATYIFCPLEIEEVIQQKESSFSSTSTTGSFKKVKINPDLKGFYLFFYRLEERKSVKLIKHDFSYKIWANLSSVYTFDD